MSFDKDNLVTSDMSGMSDIYMTCLMEEVIRENDRRKWWETIIGESYEGNLQNNFVGWDHRRKNTWDIKGGGAT